MLGTDPALEPRYAPGSTAGGVVAAAAFGFVLTEPSDALAVWVGDFAFLGSSTKIGSVNSPPTPTDEDEDTAPGSRVLADGALVDLNPPPADERQTTDASPANVSPTTNTGTDPLGGLGLLDDFWGTFSPISLSASQSAGSAGTPDAVGVSNTAHTTAPAISQPTPATSETAPNVQPVQFIATNTPPVSNSPMMFGSSGGSGGGTVPEVRIDRVSDGAEPGTPFVYRVTRTGSTDQALTVRYDFGGTANGPFSSQPDHGYGGTPNQIGLAPGMASIDVSNVVYDDALQEGSETVTVTLRPDAAYTIASGGGTSNHLILDDDFGSGGSGGSGGGTPIVSVVATDPDASEGADTGVFTISRSHGVGSLTVLWTTAGTASEGPDYELSAWGGITFADGETVKTVVLTPEDDVASEGDETAVLQLSASGGAYTLASGGGSATVTIHDNEGGSGGSGGTGLPVVSIEATDAHASEPGADTGTLTLRRNTTQGVLSVTYITGGTATPSGSSGGGDYVPLTGTATFADGHASVTVRVTPVDDGWVEGDETVVVTLASGSGGYSVGASGGSAVVIIHDNEGGSGGSGGTNGIPSAVDDVVTLNEDAGAVAVSVLDNDSDPDGHTLTVTSASGASNGTVAVSADGLSAVYTPNADFYGSDTFSYTISDGNGGTATATVSVTINPSPTVSIGDGLLGEFFTDANLTNVAFSQISNSIDYNWPSDIPNPAIGPSQFSVRWTGDVLADSSGEHTFTVDAAGGVRLWVDNQLLVDHWTDHPYLEESGTIILTAGQRYSIRLEYTETNGGGEVALSWLTATQPKQIIPVNRLFTNLLWFEGGSEEESEEPESQAEYKGGEKVDLGNAGTLNVDAGGTQKGVLTIDLATYAEAKPTGSDKFTANHIRISAYSSFKLDADWHWIQFAKVTVYGPNGKVVVDGISPTGRKNAEKQLSRVYIRNDEWFVDTLRSETNDANLTFVDNITPYAKRGGNELSFADRPALRELPEGATKVVTNFETYLVRDKKVHYKVSWSVEAKPGKDGQKTVQSYGTVTGQKTNVIPAQASGDKLAGGYKDVDYDGETWKYIDKIEYPNPLK